MRYFIFIFLFFLLTNCEEIPSSSNNNDPPIQTTIVSGQVNLENQDEHSNCAIFDSMMTLLTGTDSSGNYEIDFNSYFPDSTVRIKLFYFLHDYQIDSAEIQLSDGFIIFDSLDVDKLGNIKPINLQQLLDVTCTVSKDTAAIGDTVRYEATFKNVSDRTVALCFQVSTPAGPIIISKGPFEERYGFYYQSTDPSGGYMTEEIQPGYSYTGHFVNTIPEGRTNPIDQTLIPLLPGDYVMHSLFDSFENQEFFKSKHRSYLSNIWDFYHIGLEPNTNLPEKIKAARIHITE